MPTPAEMPHDNIYELIARTQEQSLLCEEVGLRSNINPETDKSLILAQLFIKAGSEGMLALKHQYFSDVDLYSDTFMQTDQFKRMPKAQQSAFLDNYAAVIVGVSLLAIQESVQSDGQTFLRERFAEIHSQACNNVLVRLPTYELAQDITLLGTEESLSLEQWQTMQRYVRYHFDILNPEYRDKLPKTLKAFLERTPQLSEYIERMYALFRYREEQLACREEIPTVFLDRQPVGSAFENAANDGWDPWNSQDPDQRTRRQQPPLPEP